MSNSKSPWRSSPPRPTAGQRFDQNRTLFIVVVGLALALILCTVVLRTIGVGRICGGLLVLGSGAIFLLANDKSKPGLVLLLGVLIFLFADDLLAAIF